MNLSLGLLLLTSTAVLLEATSFIRRCPKPPTGVHSSYSVKAYKLKAIATYRCRSGYVRYSGISKLICVHGRYLKSRKVLKCKPIPRPCPRAPSGLNVFVNVITKRNNAWAKYTCKSGFVRFGGRTQLDCKNGRYTSTDALKCIPIVCPAAPNGENSAVTVSPPSPAANQEATYECNPGFERSSGQTTLNCVNGEYTSDDALVCEPIFCPAAPNGENSAVTVSPPSPAANQEATYECNPGFERSSGQTRLNCVNGEYSSDDALNCEPIVCPAAPTGENSAVTVAPPSPAANQEATYECNPGFERSSGQTTLNCVNGEYTSDDALNCEPIVCPAAPTGENSAVTVAPPSPAANQEASYECNPGFERSSGQTTLNCVNGEYTSDDALNCRRIQTCPKPPQGTNSKVKKIKGSGLNQWVFYRCESSRYVKESGRIRLDCIDGSFTSTDALNCRRRLYHKRN